MHGVLFRLCIFGHDLAYDDAINGLAGLDMVTLAEESRHKSSEIHCAASFPGAGRGLTSTEPQGSRKLDIVNCGNPSFSIERSDECRSSFANW